MSDEKLENEIKRELDESLQHIDAATLSSIRQIRARAMNKVEEKSFNWTGFGGTLATVCMLMLVVILSIQNEPSVTPLTPNEIELISAMDEFELYQDLEFYEWLTEEYES
ncbi:MAG: hypothetical protein AAF410_01615 [Pseudomonadota bacterium]